MKKARELRQAFQLSRVKAEAEKLERAAASIRSLATRQDPETQQRMLNQARIKEQRAFSSLSSREPSHSWDSLATRRNAFVRSSSILSTLTFW